MIISDGTTSLTYELADETISPEIDRSVRNTAGGRLTSQSTGERISIRVKFRTTPSGFRSVMNLLKNGATRYFYTPEETYDFYTSVTFPIEVVVNKISREWDNRDYYYVQLEIESVDYI